MQFDTNYDAILAKVQAVDPLLYGKTRNYIHGAVTYLSPYISRGVISTNQVLQSVLARGYQAADIESFIKELCWRDYFQRVGQAKDLSIEIKHAQIPVMNYGVPSNVLDASTGITAIDQALRQLYGTGYMHNHCRMYTASIVCNIAQSHWLQPARWMYYHLLDGDWASNACSWQWVAGANSNKKYYANQENINNFCDSNQAGTFLDVPYESIAGLPVPIALAQSEPFAASTNLPVASPLVLDTTLPNCIYNYYNLDPLWHQHEPANRILLLEPDFFSQYPVSDKCIDFVLRLAENISGIQLYVGSFADLANQLSNEIYFKEHPLNIGYHGIEEPRDWISQSIIGYYPSFFAYWKKIQKTLFKQATNDTR